MLDTKKWAKDAAERVIATFIEAFLGAMLLSPVISISTLRAGAIAGMIAALSYVKSTVAMLLPSTGMSPASLVSTAPAPQAPNATGNYGYPSSVVINVSPSQLGLQPEPQPLPPGVSQ